MATSEVSSGADALLEAVGFSSPLSAGINSMASVLLLGFNSPRLLSVRFGIHFWLILGTHNGQQPYMNEVCEFHSPCLLQASLCCAHSQAQSLMASTWGNWYTIQVEEAPPGIPAFPGTSKPDGASCLMKNVWWEILRRLSEESDLLLSQSYKSYLLLNTFLFYLFLFVCISFVQNWDF